MVVERSPVTEGQVDAGPVECDQVPNGTPCGKPGGESHCVFDVCSRNVCGDGVRAGDETCDDGNERDHDGCDARCKIDIPSCGNGVVDPTEECDSEKRELCTIRCTKPRCGDGVVSPGEECDEGRPAGSASCSAMCKRPVASDASAADASGLEAGPQPEPDAGMDAGGADGGRDAAQDAAPDTGLDATAEAGTDAATDAGRDAAVEAGPGGEKCRACRDTSCRTYVDPDVFKGCLSAPDPDFGADATDPTFIQRCLDAVVCAQLNRCHLTSSKGASGCYCGSISGDACSQTGPAADAPCRGQWEAAARNPGEPAPTNSDVQARFSDFTYPAAWAFFLLECDVKNCSSEATGDCTQPGADNRP